MTKSKIRPCQSKNPIACPYHGVSSKLNALDTQIEESTKKGDNEGTLLLIEQRRELEKYNSPSFTENPLDPEGGFEEGPHGVQLPKLNKGWEWHFRSTSKGLILWYKNQNHKHDILGSVYKKYKNKNHFLSRAPLDAKKIIANIDKERQKLLRRKYYQGDYGKNITPKIAPIDGLVDIGKSLPEVPENQFWRVKDAHDLSLSLEEKSQGWSSRSKTLGKNGSLEEGMGMLDSPFIEKVKPRHVENIANKILKKIEKKNNAPEPFIVE